MGIRNPTGTGEQTIVRGPPNEHSFVSCLYSDIQLREEDQYTADFLVNNIKIRCEKYLVGLEQVAKERKQPIRPTNFVQPTLQYINQNAETSSSIMIEQLKERAMNFTTNRQSFEGKN